MTKRIAVTLAVALLASVGTAVRNAAAATPGSVVDQTQTTNSGSAIFTSSSWTLGETFTAGISGPLTDVDLYAASTAAGAPNLQVTITTVDGGGNPQPGNVLASTTIPTPGTVNSQTILTAHFSTPVSVTAGTQYAVLLNQPSGTQFGSFYIASGNPYAGGESDVLSSLDASDDFAFTTYVAVPVSASTDRVGYCSVPGNTWADGSPIAPGTFLNLAQGQPGSDSHYIGAYPADYLQGVGITCNVGAGFAPTGTEVGFWGDDTGQYAFYAKAG